MAVVASDDDLRSHVLDGTAERIGTLLSLCGQKFPKERKKFIIYSLHNCEIKKFKFLILKDNFILR